MIRLSSRRSLELMWFSRLATSIDLLVGRPSASARTQSRDHSSADVGPLGGCSERRDPLPAARPRLLKGFEGEVLKPLVHSRRPLIDVEHDNSNGLSSISAVRDAEPEP